MFCESKRAFGSLCRQPRRAVPCPRQGRIHRQRTVSAHPMRRRNEGASWRTGQPQAALAPATGERRRNPNNNDRIARGTRKRNGAELFGGDYFNRGLFQQTCRRDARRPTTRRPRQGLRAPFPAAKPFEAGRQSEPDADDQVRRPRLPFEKNEGSLLPGTRSVRHGSVIRATTDPLDGRAHAVFYHNGRTKQPQRRRGARQATGARAGRRIARFSRGSLGVERHAQRYAESCPEHELAHHRPCLSSTLDQLAGSSWHLVHGSAVAVPVDSSTLPRKRGEWRAVVSTRRPPCASGPRV
jgi:hypothetical protein